MVTYERREERRMVIITVDGEFDVSEVFDVLHRHGEQDNWELGTLWDLRRMSGRPTPSDLWSFSLAFVHDPATAPPHRGPTAIVTTDPEMYDRACLYVAMSRPELDIDAFRDMEEAENWLTDRLTPTAAG